MRCHLHGEYAVHPGQCRVEAGGINEFALYNVDALRCKCLCCWSRQLTHKSAHAAARFEDRTDNRITLFAGGAHDENRRKNRSRHEKPFKKVSARGTEEV